MAKETVRNVKLGSFVLAGLLFLVLLLYMIGKNRNLFGATYSLKARFENVHGLVPGNNVRFSGIEAGTVKKVRIVNDTTIEVTMMLEIKMRKVIRKDAIVSIGTDGLVGNKVVNIAPSRRATDFAEEGDFLPTHKSVNTDEMLETLYETNKDLSTISSELKRTVLRLNDSRGIWTILEDENLAMNIRRTFASFRRTAAESEQMAKDLNEVVADIKAGKGTMGSLLRDSTLVQEMEKAVLNFQSMGRKTDSLFTSMRSLVDDLDRKINTGKGAIHTLLNDSIASADLKSSLEHIRKGSDGFRQNMEALKHNIFFRGYFRRLEKQKKREMDSPATKND